MRIEDRRPSLWTETGERDYGMDLTENERWDELLEEPPSRLATVPRADSSLAARQAPAASGADQGLTDLSSHMDRRPGSVDGSRGPTSEEGS